MRAFNRYTIAYEVFLINAIFVADFAFIMSSSKSAYFPSPLVCVVFSNFTVNGFYILLQNNVVFTASVATVLVKIICDLFHIGI